MITRRQGAQRDDDGHDNPATPPSISRHGGARTAVGRVSVRPKVAGIRRNLKHATLSHRFLQTGEKGTATGTMVTTPPTTETEMVATVMGTGTNSIGHGPRATRVVPSGNIDWSFFIAPLKLRKREACDWMFLVPPHACTSISRFVTHISDGGALSSRRHRRISCKSSFLHR